MEASAMTAAFELLQEEVGAEVTRVNEEGSAAFAAGEHERAQAALERAKELKALQVQLNDLAESFRALLRPSEAVVGAVGKLGRGLKTPEELYRMPILEALVELGGKGNVDAVMDRVQAALKEQLNAYDLAPLPSDENLPRWRNTAQWARNALRTQGLLKDDSPRGIWEISAEGRQMVGTGSAPKKPGGITGIK